jgi:hypothetical protein
MAIPHPYVGQRLCKKKELVILREPRLRRGKLRDRMPKASPWENLSLLIRFFDPRNKSGSQNDSM